MKNLTIIIVLFGLFLSIFLMANFSPSIVQKSYEFGDKVDSLNGVYVYYNGAVSNVKGRNLSSDGYNLGLKYQCVEFVKRYYYEHYSHKMPDSYGHAKDFFDASILDGKKSKRRNLIQYTNPSKSKPLIGDLLVFGGTVFNKYGHVAIISGVSEESIEIIQQNPGPSASSRIKIPLKFNQDVWTIQNDRVLGWLSK